LTPYQRYLRNRQNDAWYARRFLKIKTKAGAMVNLEYNAAQKRIFEVWDRQEREGKPVRIIIVKPRRVGASTGVAARVYHRTATRKYRNALVMAHDIPGTDTLFEMYRLFYEESPPGVILSDGTRVQIQPEARYSSKKELVFDRTRSQVQIQTAGADKGAAGGRKRKRKGSGSGRSRTVHYFHGSEVAHWPSPKETLLAVLQTVANEPGTVVVLESTANGVGDEYYKRVHDAIAGRSDYELVFFSWLEFPEYARPVPAEGLGELDDEEKRLRETYGATDEQLQWRRETIRNECGGDPEMFRQEYPSDVEEAFLVSGHPFFNRAAVLRARDRKDRKGMCPPAAIGKVVWDVDKRTNKGSWVWLDDPGGYVHIWQKPRPFGAYCIGADTAEGTEDGDYCCAEVWDRDTGEQVAEWHGRMDPDQFGDELYKLGMYYNYAWIGPEANKHGKTTCDKLKEKRYLHLYERKILDERYPESTDKIGWLTTAQTRPPMLDELERLIREGEAVLHSEILFGELLSFVRDESGKPQAEEGAHDDTVLALAIALQMHKLCPMSRPEDPKVLAERKRHAEQAARQRDKYTGY
jgi:hypothetical protein